MMLGKRARPPMKRTTSMTEFTLDLNQPCNTFKPALPSPSSHRHTSSDFVETAHFLKFCFLCGRHLISGRDIYMYSVGSTDKKPDSQCCNGLMTVLKTEVECVCEALKSTAQLGINIDMQRAAALPSACNTKAPSLDGCHISSVSSPSSSNPSAAPVSSASSPSSDPSAAPVSSAPNTRHVEPPVSSAPSTNQVEPPANSPAMAAIGAAPVSPKTQAPTGPVSSNSPAPVSQVSSSSPAPVPQVSSSSPAPVPQVSSSSPAPVQYDSPLSPAQISPSQAPTRVNYHAPAPSPTSGHHFAMVKRYDVFISMLVASIFYLLA